MIKFEDAKGVKESKFLWAITCPTGEKYDVCFNLSDLEVLPVCSTITCVTGTAVESGKWLVGTLESYTICDTKLEKQIEDKTEEDEEERFLKKARKLKTKELALINWDEKNLNEVKFDYVRSDPRVFTPSMYQQCEDRWFTYLETLEYSLENYFKKVIYIWAPVGGEGKTKYAKELALKSYNKFEVKLLPASTDNCMDQYSGEKCIILDDLRGSQFRYSTLLNMLDPYNSNSAAARYHNKAFTRCEQIIITSVKSPLELYANENIQESIYQLIRRFNEMYKIEIEDGHKYLVPYEYNKEERILEPVDWAKEELEETQR